MNQNCMRCDNRQKLIDENVNKNCMRCDNRKNLLTKHMSEHSLMKMMFNRSKKD